MAISASIVCKQLSTQHNAHRSAEDRRLCTLSCAVLSSRHMVLHIIYT